MNLVSTFLFMKYFKYRVSKKLMEQDVRSVEVRKNLPTQRLHYFYLVALQNKVLCCRMTLFLFLNLGNLYVMMLSEVRVVDSKDLQSYRYKLLWFRKYTK